jgi:sigma-E factor negative regulatory protein RseB
MLVRVCLRNLSEKHTSTMSWTAYRALGVCVISLASSLSVTGAQAQSAASLDLVNPGADPLAWLARSQKAAREQNYIGVFVQTVGDIHSTSRITHSFFDGQEVEKIEALDGPLSEFLRRGNNLQCLTPQSRTVRSDLRVAGRHFPQLVQTTVQQVAGNYHVMLGAGDRVAGYDCRWLHLNPKDGMRYAQRFCSEVSTGLLVRAKLIGAGDQVLEQFTFTELKVGPRVTRSALRSRWEEESNRWKQQQSNADAAPAVVNARTGWGFNAIPPGFAPVAELRRTFPSKVGTVDHLILSDGIASMSVFIEPLPDGQKVKEAVAANGCSSIYVGTAAIHPSHLPSLSNNVATGPQNLPHTHMVTVMGEVPTQTAVVLGKSVVSSPRPTRARSQ